MEKQTAPTHSSDRVIQLSVMRSLEGCTAINPACIGVAVSYGTVQLFGVVRSDRERDAALDCAFTVPGVTSIANDIRSEDATYPASDLGLAAEIRAVLVGDDKIRDLPVQSQVTDGVARLRGSVSSQAQHDILIDVVTNLSGIVSVDDRVTIDALASR